MSEPPLLFLDGRVAMHAGDCRDVIKELSDNSIDACVTDPPYSLVSIVKRFGKEGSAPAQFGSDGCYARASAGFMGKPKPIPIPPWPPKHRNRAAWPFVSDPPCVSGLKTDTKG